MAVPQSPKAIYFLNRHTVPENSKGAVLSPRLTMGSVLRRMICVCVRVQDEHGQVPRIHTVRSPCQPLGDY